MAAETRPQEDVYDNQITYLYRLSKYYEVPVAFLVAFRNDSGNIDYKTLDDVMEEFDHEGEETLLELYNGLKELNPNIDVNFFIFAYIDSLPDTISDEDIISTIKQLLTDVGMEDDASNINTASDVELFVTSEEERFDEHFRIDKQRGEEIEVIQNDLKRASTKEENGNFVQSKINYNSAFYTFTPLYRDKLIPDKGGYEIFDLIIPSKYLLYAQYVNEDGAAFHKLYTGEDFNYGNVLVNQTRSNNMIYMSLWIGDSVGGSRRYDLFTSPKELFLKINYDLTNGYMEVNIPFILRGTKVGNLNVVKQRIEAALPGITLTDLKEVKVRADVKLIPVYPSQRIAQDTPLQPPEKQFEIDEHEHIFLHLLLNNNAFYRNIYAEESTVPYPLKKRLDFHYRSMYSDIREAETPIDKTYISNSAAVSFTLNIRKTIANETLEVLNSEGDPFRVKTAPNYNYISINITVAESREAIQEFLRIIQPLLIIYYWEYVLGQKDHLVAHYNGIVPLIRTLPELKERIRHPTGESSVKIPGRHQRNVKSETRISQLRSKHGDVFGGLYSRRCQKSQPVAYGTEQEAIEYASSHPYTRQGKQIQREYLRFPASPAPAKFYFVCPDNSHPIPGVINNTTGHNEKIYPYLPCCFSKFDRNTNPIYAQYYRGKKIEQRDRTSKTITTYRVLDPGRVGELPPPINKALSKQTELSSHFFKYGSVKSPNSLLHSVLLAIGDREYLSQSTFEGLENRVRQVRESIARQVRPELLKQELYDTKDEDITESLFDFDVYLDPSKYFRALEYVFKINIFVFTIPRGGSASDTKMLIPENRYFHAGRANINYPTILIYKNYGNRSDKSSQPQNELIINVDDPNPKNVTTVQRMFGQKVTKRCNTIMEHTLGTVTWKMVDENNLKAYLNIYDKIDFQQLLDGNVVSQYIDDHGKARSYNINFVGRMLTLMVPPSRPLNVPRSEEIFPTTLSLIKELLNVRLLSSVFFKSDQSEAGVWLSALGIKNVIYIPIQNGTDLPQLPPGPPNPVTTRGNSVIQRLRKLRKTLSIIIQLIKWVFDIFRRGKISGQLYGRESRDTYEEFIRNYFVIYPEPITDSSTFYDISRINRLLPEGYDMNNALRHVAEGMQTLMLPRDKPSGGKFIMYNSLFYEKIVKELETYFNSTFDSIPSPQDQIIGYYTEYTDFTQYPDTEIFITSNSLEHWISGKSEGGRKKMTIRKTLDINFQSELNPFIYRLNMKGTDYVSKMYLIQNPGDGTLKSSISIGYHWHVEKFNLGSADIPESIMPVYMMYAISATGDVVIVDNKTGGNPAHLSVLYYGTPANFRSTKSARYGAMLPIL